jgi:peroxiredoxin
MLRVSVLVVAIIACGGTIWALDAVSPIIHRGAGEVGMDDQKKAPEVGDAAPDFSVKAVDGKKDLKLSAFKGKYLLLDFWATWCGPCREELPNIKKAWADYGKDSQLAIISLSLDKTPQDAAAYGKENGMDWSMGFLPGAWDSPVVSAYGVDGIPSIWLIGPNGKVIAKELRGDDIEAAVKQALAK